MGGMAEAATERWPLALIPEAGAPSAIQKIINALRSR
jgi:hypothetical protein